MMTEFEWLWIQLCLYGFPILLVVLTGVIVAWGIWEFWYTPKEAKQIRSAKRKKAPLSLDAGDDGYANFNPLPQRGDEGYLATTKNPKGKHIGFLARHTTSIGDDFEVAEGKDKELTKKVAEYINRLSSRKLYLRYAKIPIWFGYTGKAILTSLYSLIALETLEELQTNGGDPKTNPFLKVDLYAIKSLFSKPWDQTQIRNQEIRAKMEGTMEAKKWAGKEPIMWMIVVTGFALGMGILLIVAMHFFG